jgi:hypothetical protein
MSANGNSLHYRILPPDEWPRLEPIFKELNAFLPPSFLATAAVAENSEHRIVGLAILQAVLHAEPWYVDTKYSGLVNLHHLWKLLEELPQKKAHEVLTPGFLIVAPDEKIKRLAEIAGFGEIAGTLMRKEW